MRQFLKGFFVGIGFLLFFIFGLVTTKAFEVLTAKNTTTLTKHIEVSKAINYDEFVSYPRFSAGKNLATKIELSEEEQQKVYNDFGLVLEEVKKSDMCSGGGFALEQNYSHKDGVLAPNGYRFSANFECKFKESNSDEYKNLINTIDKIAKNNSYIVLNVPTIHPRISDELLSNVQNELYDMLFAKANELSKEYSSKLEKECKIKDINSANNIYISNKAMYEDTAYATPIIKPTNQKLVSTITYECK